MVCNATFNNISVISLRSVLLVEETGNERGIMDLNLLILNYAVSGTEDADY